MGAAIRPPVDKNICAALLAALAWGAGCESKASSPDPIALEDWPTRFEAVTCAWRVACSLDPSVPTCEASLQYPSRRSWLTLRAAIDRGTVLYDAEAAGACLRERFTGFGCSELEAMYGEQPDACLRTFTGTVPLGGTCFAEEECAGEAYCSLVTTYPCVPAICVAAGQALVPLGGDCSVAGSQCTPGAFCADGETCTALLPAGSPCSSTLVCRFPKEVCYAGICRVPPDEGEACDPIGSDYGGPCRRIDDRCNDATGLCTRLPGPGESCASTKTCVPYAECDNDVCVAQADLGQSCDLRSCIGELACTGGVCGPPPAETACGPAP